VTDQKVMIVKLQVKCSASWPMCKGRVNISQRWPWTSNGHYANSARRRFVTCSTAECDRRTDGQTDRQTDGIAIASTVLAIRALRHAFKNVRNNLQRHNIQVHDGTASWNHIQQFYHTDKISPIRLAPKLTDHHINVVSTTKMRVSLAAQVLSHSAAAGINMQVMTNELPGDATSTADFVDKIDKLFDLLNTLNSCAVSSAGVYTDMKFY